MSSLTLLDDHEDIKKLLIYYALFSFNFERLIGKLAELSMAITKKPSSEEKTGGQWINHVKKLFENNLNLNDADMLVWERIRKRLWELNKKRIELLKGVKYYQKETDARGASVVTYKLSDDSPEWQEQTCIYLDQIIKNLDECEHLELVLESLIECINKKVNIAEVFTEEDGRFTINIYPLMQKNLKPK